MSGSAEFEITIDKNANTEAPTTTRPPRRDVRPQPKPAGGAEPGATPKPPAGSKQEPPPGGPAAATQPN
jgi:hypothetical protein